MAAFLCYFWSGPFWSTLLLVPRSPVKKHECECCTTSLHCSFDLWHTYKYLTCCKFDVSELHQVSCEISQVYPAHALYTLCICWGCPWIWYISEVTGLLFYHTVIIFCLHSISTLGRCSRCVWGCLILDNLVTCVCSTLGNPQNRRNRNRDRDRDRDRIG